VSQKARTTFVVTDPSEIVQALVGLKDVRGLHYERRGPDVELMIEQCDRRPRSRRLSPSIGEGRVPPHPQIISIARSWRCTTLDSYACTPQVLLPTDGAVLCSDPLLRGKRIAKLNAVEARTPRTFKLEVSPLVIVDIRTWRDCNFLICRLASQRD